MELKRWSPIQERKKERMKTTTKKSLIIVNAEKSFELISKSRCLWPSSVYIPGNLERWFFTQLIDSAKKNQVNSPSLTESCPAEKTKLPRKEAEDQPHRCSLLTQHCPLFQSRERRLCSALLFSARRLCFRAKMLHICQVYWVYYCPENHYTPAPPDLLPPMERGIQAFECQVMSLSSPSVSVFMNTIHF